MKRFWPPSGVAEPGYFSLEHRRDSRCASYRLAFAGAKWRKIRRKSLPRGLGFASLAPVRDFGITSENFPTKAYYPGKFSAFCALCREVFLFRHTLRTKAPRRVPALERTMTDDTCRRVTSPVNFPSPWRQVRWRLVPAVLLTFIGLFFVTDWVCHIDGAFTPYWKSKYQYPPSWTARIYQLLFLLESLVAAGCWLGSALYCYRRRYWPTVLGVVIAISLFAAAQHHRQAFLEKWRKQSGWSSESFVPVIPSPSERSLARFRES